MKYGRRSSSLGGTGNELIASMTVRLSDWAWPYLTQSYDGIAQGECRRSGPDAPRSGLCRRQDHGDYAIHVKSHTGFIPSTAGSSAAVVKQPRVEERREPRNAKMAQSWHESCSRTPLIAKVHSQLMRMNSSRVAKGLFVKRHRTS